METQTTTKPDPAPCSVRHEHVRSKKEQCEIDRKRRVKEINKEHTLTRSSARTSKEANHQAYLDQGNPVDLCNPDNYGKCPPGVATIIVSAFTPDSETYDPVFHTFWKKRCSKSIEPLLTELKGMDGGAVLAWISHFAEKEHKPLRVKQTGSSSSGAEEPIPEDIPELSEEEVEVVPTPKKATKIPLVATRSVAGPPDEPALVGRVVPADDETDVRFEQIAWVNIDHRPTGYRNIAILHRDIVLQHVCRYRRVSLWILPVLAFVAFVFAGRLKPALTSLAISLISGMWRYRPQLALRFPNWLNEIFDVIPDDVQDMLEYARMHILLVKVVSAERVVAGFWLEELFAQYPEGCEIGAAFSVIRRSMQYYMPDSMYSVVMADTVAEYADMVRRLNTTVLAREHQFVPLPVEPASVSSDIALANNPSSRLLHNQRVSSQGMCVCLSLVIVVTMIVIAYTLSSPRVAAAATLQSRQIEEMLLDSAVRYSKESHPTYPSLIDWSLTTLRVLFMKLCRQFLLSLQEIFWASMNGLTQLITTQAAKLNYTKLMNECVPVPLQGIISDALTALSKQNVTVNSSTLAGSIQGVMNSSATQDLTSSLLNASSIAQAFLSNMSRYLTDPDWYWDSNVTEPSTEFLTTLPLRALSGLRFCVVVSVSYIVICLLTCRRLAGKFPLVFAASIAYVLVQECASWFAGAA